MSEADRPPRKAYRKPEVTRVDLVEDEVALATCKASFVASHSTPNVGVSKCKSNCKSIAAT